MAVTAGTGPEFVKLNANRSGRPLVCIHPVGGHINEYVRLGDALSDAYATFGVISRARLDATAEHASIDAMAEDYAELACISGLRPPLAIFGWSMGAVVAHAVACALEQRGVEVHFVGMVDPLLLAPSTQEEDQVHVDLGMAVRIHNPGGPSGRTLRRTLEGCPTGPLEDSASLFDWCRGQGLLPDGVTVSAFTATVGLFSRHRQLLRTHRPSRCRAPLLVWTADQRYHREPFDWGCHTSGGTVERGLQGAAHYTIMGAPFLDEILSDLRGRATTSVR